MSTATPKTEIVIIGGGIIGSTTAYYLTRHPSYSRNTHHITLLEAAPHLAPGASGKAGGLLARWAYPAALAALSFRLHAQLAREHGGAGRWGFREVGCGQLDVDASAQAGGAKHSGSDANGAAAHGVSLQKRTPAALKQLQAAGVPEDLDWVDSDAVRGYEAMAEPGATAQVQPALFTRAMAALAEEAGVDVRLNARVTGIEAAEQGEGGNGSVAVAYEDAASGKTTSLAAHRVLVAAGPWTRTLLPQVPIGGLRAHSVTIRPSRPVSAYVLFTAIKLPRGDGGGVVSPEIYARPDGEVYACGEGDTLAALPGTAGEVEIVQTRCEEVVKQVGRVSEALRDGEVLVRQACYLPVGEGGGGPWIGEVSGGRGAVFVAAGHTCWGIQNAPGTGKVVSEILMGGKAESLDLGKMDAKMLAG